MSQSSYIQAQVFKSPLAIVAGFLLRSRDTQGKRAKERTEEIQQLRLTVTRLRRDQLQTEHELAQAKLRIEKLQVENASLRNQPPSLPDDPRLPLHSYGPKMISLCVNLARSIGLRPAETALQIVFDGLDVTTKIPDWTTIRSWLCRVGVAAVEEPVEPADDWIWMADHSNQIGPEKAFAILGIRASQLPKPGQTIRHEDMRVLAVIPGVQWKREDVAREYTALAERIGAPMAILVDGAVELREGAEALEKQRKNIFVVNDFKHYAANVLKRVVGKDERFEKFLSSIGRTRSAIQQTELAHLTPPAQKPKARFMNLGATLLWATMVLWQLSNPNSEGRREISTKRMNEKLGWLRSFRDDVRRWNGCQAVVSQSVTLINEQGLFVGAADQLQEAIADLAIDDASNQVAEQLVQFVRDSEAQLDKGMRLPMSTEILESSFGLYKRLERQHSKGGFTSLLAAFGALLRPTTPETIAKSFARVKVRHMRQWIVNNLGSTLASKRNSAYREFATARGP